MIYFKIRNVSYDNRAFFGEIKITFIIDAGCLKKFDYIFLNYSSHMNAVGSESNSVASESNDS